MKHDSKNTYHQQQSAAPGGCEGQVMPNAIGTLQVASGYCNTGQSTFVISALSAVK